MIRIWDSGFQHGPTIRSLLKRDSSAVWFLELRVRVLKSRVLGYVVFQSKNDQVTYKPRDWIIKFPWKITHSTLHNYYSLSVRNDITYSFMCQSLIWLLFQFIKVLVDLWFCSLNNVVRASYSTPLPSGISTADFKCHRINANKPLLQCFKRIIEICRVLCSNWSNSRMESAQYI